MSVYTTVTADELSAWLGDYDVGTLTDSRGISAGIENTNYFVWTTTGRYVLTLFEKLTASELPFYLGLMAHLADHGIPSARPVANREGSFLGELNGKPAALVSFLSGKDIDRPTADHCAAVGTMLAQIHLAGMSYSTRMENPRGLSWWREVVPELVPFIGPDEAKLLKSEVDFHSRCAFPSLPSGAIHADLFRDNVLFEKAHLSGVIDFYFACTDRLLYDVAISVNDWCMSDDGALDPKRTQALLDAYSETRPWSDDEPAAWPVMLRAAALRFWISRLYDYYLPRTGELTHAKDPAHFQRILEHHIQTEQRLCSKG